MVIVRKTGTIPTSLKTSYDLFSLRHPMKCLPPSEASIVIVSDIVYGMILIVMVSS